MPWTNKQVRGFAAAAHNKGISERMGIPQDKARKMEMEASPEQRSEAMSMQHAMAKRLRKGKSP